MTYDYTLAPEANNDVFSAQCAALKAIGYALGERLVDVDGSIISTYRKGTAVAEVWLDYYVDAVYMKSSVDLAESVVSAAAKTNKTVNEALGMED